MEDGRLAAVLVWCAAAWHLKDRDEAVGWDAVIRSERLKLVIQLRRFVVLEEARRPNLASQCLGLGPRELTAQWERKHGYRPLLAESFSDPEACRGALVGRGGARSPLKLAQLKSLRDAFLEVPDPRRPQSRRHPLSAMLTLIALGLLMGARDVFAIWKKVACLSQSQRDQIGLKIRHKESGQLKMPGYDALNDLLNAVDPVAYARALTAWLQANTGTLPRSLAIDGKTVGDGSCGMTITLCHHEDGRPVAMAPASGKKEDCEAPVARALPADPQVALENAVVSADPLHNIHDTARVIVEKGGDYVIGTKKNTSKRLEGAARVLAGTPLLQSALRATTAASTSARRRWFPPVRSTPAYPRPASP
jgi:hypothetical protein